MVSITKTLFRTALIGGLAVGGLALVVGPQRVAGGYHQVQHTVVSWFDNNMDDPIILRHQLKKLQQEYPQRLRTLTRKLAEVEGKIDQLNFDREVASNAVNFAKTDLASLKGLVGAAQTQFAAYDGTGREVLIRFQGTHLTVDEAYSRAQRIKQSAMNNQDKVAAFDRELQVLQTYRGRLVEQKTKLEKEFTTFQTQLWHIERQIDQIQQNEELIDLMEECNSGLAEFDKFEIKNLPELENRLSAIQTEQNSVLDAMENSVTGDSYEDRARDAMRQSDSFDDVFSLDLNSPKVDRSAFPTTPIIVDESVVEQQREQKVDNDTIARLESADQN